MGGWGGGGGANWVVSAVVHVRLAEQATPNFERATVITEVSQSSRPCYTARLRSRDYPAPRWRPGRPVLWKFHACFQRF